MNHESRSNLLPCQAVHVPTPIDIAETASSQIPIVDFDDMGCEVRWRRRADKIDLDQETGLVIQVTYYGNSLEDSRP